MKPFSTALTDLFNIQVPIIQAGMIWVSGWKLAAAVSRAGGLGLIGAGSMRPEVLDLHLTRMKDNCDRPFGVNLPVFNPYAEALAEVCLRHEVKIIFSSAGSPKRFTPMFKRAGARVVHVVPSVALAKKVEAAGCDAVVAEGTEAGGHNGFEEITSINLWPSVVDAVRIPVIAAGGIVDGRSMAAAMALGAAGVQVGTRFAATPESSANAGYKDAIVRAGEADVKLYLRRFMPTRTWVNPYVKRTIDAEQRGATREELDELRGSGRARQGIFEGDQEEGELEMGLAASRVEKILGAEQVVREMVDEFWHTIGKLVKNSG